MTLKEVAQTLDVSEGAFRTRMCRQRKTAGGNASYPEPMKKIAGAWFWDRRAVARFVAKAKANDAKPKTPV